MKQYYFQYFAVGDPCPYFLVTPKNFFDKHGYLSDESSAVKMPQGFSELMEAHYEYEGDPKVGIAALKAAGFIEFDMDTVMKKRKK